MSFWIENGLNKYTKLERRRKASMPLLARLIQPLQRGDPNKGIIVGRHNLNVRYTNDRMIMADMEKKNIVPLR